MLKKRNYVLILVFSIFLINLSMASSSNVAVDNFKRVHSLQHYFKDSYGYAIFPTVGSGGIGIGGSYGSGEVFKHNEYMGDAQLFSLSIGFQLGGRAYSEIIFFRNKAAYEQFTGNDITLSANASGTLITLGANAQVGTSGTTAAAGLGAISRKTSPVAAGHYTNGLAAFVVDKGGLMYKFALKGQNFSYSPKKQMGVTA